MRLFQPDKRVRAFINKQINQIRRGGLPVLLRKLSILFWKAYTILRILLITLLLAPVVLLARLLGPIVLIRFGPLTSSRIGHFVADTEVYLCERDAGMHGQRTIDIFYHRRPICNYQIKKMWDRTILTSSLAGPLDIANRHLPGGKKHAVPMRTAGGRDIHGLLEHIPAHLSFTAEEEEFGQNELRKLGIPAGSPFVCFHARSSEYLNNLFPKMDWNYQDYRDSDIHNYILAAEELVRRGYFAVRMGAGVKEELPVTSPKIIDYAVNDRTDFLDIFLSAKCKFFIGSVAGIASVAMVFRRPIAWMNFIPLEHLPAWSPNELFIPKKLWLRKEARFLTFSEILNSGIGRFLRSEEYEQLGIKVVENTPEEIAALAVEMDERLKGTWQTTEEDQELKRRFWALFKPSDLNQIFLLGIGTEFLRQNRELLGDTNLDLKYEVRNSYGIKG